ncbi:MAG TPA: hypothetical protein VII09_11405 [Opitutaceae bacterium]
MNDQEFIELLNLYVDREISAADALRLEAEVASDAKRRKIYDQYCRIQKACTLLSEDFPEAVAGQAEHNVIAFPAPRTWNPGTVFAGLAAAAACALILFGYRYQTNTASAPIAVADAPRPQAVVEAADLPSDAMKPVFFARLPVDQVAGAQRALFAAGDASSQMAQLNWIGDIHMHPVFPAANADFLLNGKTDLKAAVLTDSPAGRDDLVPAEMSAFRFQR